MTRLRMIAASALTLALTFATGVAASDTASARAPRDGWGEYQRPIHYRQAFAPVRLVNDRAQWVSVFVDGRFLTTLAPRARVNLDLPVGFHHLTYRVGHRHFEQSIAVNVRPFGKNRVVIPSFRDRFERVGWR